MRRLLDRSGAGPLEAGVVGALLMFAGCAVFNYYTSDASWVRSILFGAIVMVFWVAAFVWARIRQ